MTFRAVFTGAGSVIPNRRVPNEAFASNRFFLDRGTPLDPADNPAVLEKIREITEISERRYAEDDQVASDLGTSAARAALQDADLDPETLDYLVVAHNFGDVRADCRYVDTCPTLAARIKQNLGIANPACVAYDLPFGCAGWLQAVIQADYFIRSGDARSALVVGAETLSRVSDPHDRDSMIYADGAGAVVMEAVSSDGEVGIRSHACRSDTLDHARLLRMGVSYDPSPGDGLFLKMEGRKLYEYAVQTVPLVIRDSLERAGKTLTDVAKVLVHQANAKLDASILRRLFRLYDLCDPPAALMPMTISWLGNSSVATLPTLFDLIRRGELDGHEIHPGDLVVFAAVGAGMNTNALVYRCP